MRLFANTMITLIKGYQLFISPYLGQHCRFSPTCSHFAVDAFKKYPAYKAFYLTVCRLLKCHPWHPGGYDPVP